MNIISEAIIDGGKRLDFEFEGRKCILCIPDNPRADKRVLWRAEFFGAFDKCDSEMLKRGWYRAHISVSNMFGAPKAIEIMKKFHDFLVSEYGLNTKMVLVGLSRGGLYSVNYAATYPEDISSLYLDAPVMSYAKYEALYEDIDGGKYTIEEINKYNMNISLSREVNDAVVNIKSAIISLDE